MHPDFDQLMNEYGSMLSRVAAGYEANLHLRQELVQEICLAVWQALRSFKGDSSIKTYILRVAHNKAVNHVAYHSRQPVSADIETQPIPHACDKQGPEGELQQSRQMQQLLAHIRQLPIQSRQVLTMSMEGLSYQEIAEVCGLSSSNVGVILNRVKQNLAEKLKNE